MEDYAILGGGGLALEIADCMLSEEKKICGYYSPAEDATLSSIIPYLGDERKNFYPKWKYIVASGLIHIRKKMIDFIETNHLSTGSFISKQAHVSKTASLGKGVIVFPFAVVDSFASVGDYVFFNFHSVIGHHSSICENVVVGPGAKITGNCQIGKNVSIGSNSALIPGTILEDDVEVGILTYTTRKIKKGRFILSEPGRVLR